MMPETFPEYDYWIEQGIVGGTGLDDIFETYSQFYEDSSEDFQQFIDLICEMLKWESTKRITMDDILLHPFITK